MNSEIIKYGDCEFIVPYNDLELRKLTIESVKRVIGMTGEVPQKVLVNFRSNSGVPKTLWAEVLPVKGGMDE